MPRRAKLPDAPPKPDPMGLDSFMAGLEAIELPPDDPSVPNRPAKPKPYVPIHIRDEERQVMSACMTAGYGSHQRALVMQAKFGSTSEQAYRIYKEVVREWQADDRDNESVKGPAAEMRLHRSITGASKAGNWSAVASMERVMAEVQGTKKPEVVKVEADIRITAALAGIFGELTADEAQRVIEREVRRSLPPKADDAEFIDVEPEAAQ